MSMTLGQHQPDIGFRRIVQFLGLIGRYQADVSVSRLSTSTLIVVSMAFAEVDVGILTTALIGMLFES